MATFQINSSGSTSAYDEKLNSLPQVAVSDNLVCLNRYNLYGSTAEGTINYNSPAYYHWSSVVRDRAISEYFNVVPGEILRCHYFIRSTAYGATASGGSTGSYANVRLGLYCSTNTGTVSYLFFDTSYVASASPTWTEISGTVTVPAVVSTTDPTANKLRAVVELQADKYPTFSGYIDLAYPVVSRSLKTINDVTTLTSNVTSLQSSVTSINSSLSTEKTVTSFTKVTGPNSSTSTTTGFTGTVRTCKRGGLRYVSLVFTRNFSNASSVSNGIYYTGVTVDVPGYNIYGTVICYSHATVYTQGSGNQISMGVDGSGKVFINYTNIQSYSSSVNTITFSGELVYAP